MSSGQLWATPTEVGYIGVFFISSIICLLALFRARAIDNDEIRIGLVGLLAMTGIWALLKTVYFLVSGTIAETIYLFGLVSGFGTVWAWLYFCSAYTGREYHKNRTLRRLGLGVFLTVVVVKVTNPLHELYFTTAQVSQPFSYLAIEHGPFHWTATALSYTLAAVGLFMLFEFYAQSGYRTRPLAGLTVLLGLPVSLDIVAIATPEIINFIYAPLGVAAFAVGSLFVFEQQFAAVGTTDLNDAATVFVDDEGRIRDYTAEAAAALPALADATGDQLADTLPAVSDVLDDDDQQVVEYEDDDESRYFVVSTRTTSTRDASVEVITLSDVTELETQRRQLLRREQELAQRNELHRAVIAASFAFISRIDEQRQFTFVSQSVQDALGYSPDELTGESIMRLIPNEQAASEARESISAVFDGDRLEVEEFPVETKRGRVVYTDIRAVPIYEPGVPPEERTEEDIVGAQIMSRDTTDRRQREGLISVMNRVLRHNVRNKLTVIKGYSSDLEARLDGEDGSKATKVVDSAERLLDLTESAREIEKNREMSPELEDIDIVPILDRLVDEVTDKFPAASVTVDIPETATVRSLPRIETGLWELLENAAVHGGDPAEIKITVTETDQQLGITIRDYGPGIPEQERQVLATGTEEPLVHGQGLGLFLTYWLVGNLDGDISVEKRTKGTAVTIQLPAATDQQREQQRA
ncbi:MAG: PAS sensor histidine kinase [Halonotius sp. J07HN6]|nr:MAG: PAS sensor histidine kinase [Halonotius sp. J07HN6]ERH05688.1 MAG: PAS sensor histidine kinase [Halonotius sp. J07HN4]